MAIVVSDTFNRADDPSSLGTADTGQVWSLVSGDFPFGILSNQAYWNRVGVGDAGIDAKVVVDSGLTNMKASVKLMNISAGGGLNLRNQGIVLKYVDATHYLMLVYFDASGTTGFRCYIADGGVATARANGNDALVLVDGDTISFAACGQVLECYLNGVLEATTDFNLGNNGAVMSATLLAGTQCGVQASGGIISDTDYQTYEDFVVETNGTCSPTYNCTVDGCVDPGDGTGEFGTLALCEAACSIAESYNCVEGECIDPGDGSGEFATLAECQLSGCGFEPAGVATKRFDDGEGSSWYIVPPVIDSGNELRSKVVKSMRATGRLTEASMKAYGYDVNDEINTTDLEEGTNASTRAQDLPDSTQVAQGPRKQINVKNAVLSTVRLEGNDEGQEERDEIHEIVIEHSDQGVRR